jgi:hypothetical protein
MSDPWVGALMGILPFVVIFLPFYLWLLFGRRYHCPQCGHRLPSLISPVTKTRRQWLEGGWICPNCGYEVDSHGEKVTMAWAPNWRNLWVQCAFLAGAVGVGILLICFTLHSLSPAAPRDPEPEQHPAAPIVAAPGDEL